MSRPDLLRDSQTPSRLMSLTPGTGWKSLISGEWRGEAWRHDVFLELGRDNSKVCLIEVSGDNVQGEDEPGLRDMARRTGLAVAGIFDVPNQPIFELREDDLIACTFDRYLESGEPDWPLLFPMVRSVRALMDGLTAEFGFERYCLTGASKRGWTVWLAALLDDPRVVGIVPRVIDNLFLERQLENQHDLWGVHSPMIEPYIAWNLPPRLNSERGHDLIASVDPGARLSQLKCPVLVASAANDPYWAPNAVELFWSEIPGRKYCQTAPNHGHGHLTFGPWAESIAAFSRHVLLGSDWPDSWLRATSRRFWAAELADCRTDGVEWKIVENPQNLVPPCAWFEEGDFSADGLHFSLTTPVSLRR